MTITRRQECPTSGSTIFLPNPRPLPPSPPFLQGFFSPAPSSQRHHTCAGVAGIPEGVGCLEQRVGDRAKRGFRTQQAAWVTFPQLTRAARGLLQVQVFLTQTPRGRGRGAGLPPPLPFTLVPRPARSRSLLSTRGREPGPGTGQALACHSDPESTSLWPDLRPPGAYLGSLLGFVGASARSTPTPG